MDLRRIGSGFCGSVWATEENESTSAFKREDGGPGRSLLNDFHMHQQILESVTRFIRLQKRDTETIVQIPHCYRFIESGNETWWSTNSTRFPSGYLPCNVLQSERIPPISQDAREMLIDKYCPMSLMTEIKTSNVNEDCLIRPYLGRRRVRGDRPSRFQAFSLRNFPLHIDQMEEMGLGADILKYAQLMAEALAVIHWYGKIDANDVEFVLASPRHDTAVQSQLSNILGNHTMWLLDFDCCKRISMDLDGVDQAVNAFFRNDPFYPRPDQPLWKYFRDRYLQTSSMILMDNYETIRLSVIFIEKIQQINRSRTNSTQLLEAIPSPKCSKFVSE